jgi:membrane peptidoglycan carboxypeptidase
MRKFASILIAALIVSATTVSFVAGWSYGYYGARVNLPPEQELAALSATNGICRPQGARDFLTLETTPPLVRSAVLAAEDPDFFERPPVNPAYDLVRAMFDSQPRSKSFAISAAVERCLMSLSQQCWRTRLDWHVCGFILAYRMETRLSKEFIFELYLNETRFGRGAYGAAAAASAYFAKSLSDLTTDEAAFIAALPGSSYFLARNPGGVKERRNLVIDRMLAAGAIAAEEAAAAKERPLPLQTASVPDKEL